VHIDRKNDNKEKMYCGERVCVQKYTQKKKKEKRERERETVKELTRKRTKAKA